MKLSEQIIGLPLYSLAEGKSIGTIKSLVCNPAKGTVDALLLDAKTYYLEMRGVSLDSVIGIGEFAATVEDAGVVKLISLQPSILALLETDVKVLGSRVLTKMGEIIGTVTELAIDEKTGAIIGCELTPSKSDVNRGFIARSDVITFSQQYLVVDDKCTKRLADTPDELVYVTQPDGEQAVNTDTSTDLETKTDADPSTDMVVINDQTSVKDAPEKDTHDVTNLFHERQRQFLLGRKVDRRLVAASGEVIAEQGEEITEALIERAIALDKYLELTMNTNK